MNDEDRSEEQGHMDKAEELSSQKVIRKKQSRFLKCRFTGVEKAELSMRMADAVTKITDLEAELKAIKSQHTSKIDEQRAIVTHSASSLTSGYESREVEVEITQDYETGKYMEARMDTSEVIVERELSDTELQMEFNPAATD